VLVVQLPHWLEECLNRTRSPGQLDSPSAL